jgi:hypothetical protein
MGSGLEISLILISSFLISVDSGIKDKSILVFQDLTLYS